MTDTYGATGSKSESREAKRATDQFREQAQVVRDDLRELSRSGKEAAKEFVHEARDSASQSFAAGKERLAGARDQLASYVEEHPMKSVLIAAAAGAVLGAILCRRR